jgi:putative spermidine/putrescine transport system permease protein
VAVTSTGGRRLSAFFHRRPGVRTGLLIAPGFLWLGVLYLGSLAALLVYSFWRLDPSSIALEIDRSFTLETYRRLLDGANREIIIRTATMAAAVTIACAVLAFPVAYYMARFATRRMKTVLYLAVIMPLWSSYLVRSLAWRQILTEEGIFNWAADRLGLDGVVRFVLEAPVVGGPSIVQSKMSLFVVFVYLWLPFMILPVQAALERVPGSFIEASADLGAHPRMTFRKVILPLAKPGLVAGSIFTFSLTLGDFILPGIFSTSEPFLGQVVLVQQGTAGNLPLAAAFTAVAMVIMILYLIVAKRAGAFESL